VDSTIPTPTSRRQFLQRGALAALTIPAAATLASCADTASQAPNANPQAGGHDASPPAQPTARQSADQMDAMHEAGIKAFPAPTAGKGNQVMEPVMDGKVKVYTLTAAEMQWETEPGKHSRAFAYNGQVPGPQIRVKEGDRVRVVLNNQLPESTVIHFHGLEVPNDQDGVPYITQPPVKPGESYTYEFTVPNAGSHMYHSHHNSANQVMMGLLGAFVVEPKRPIAIERADVDYVMILNDGPLGFTINGKGFPATEPIVVKRGQKLRMRYMNEGMMIHPMHLHGMHMTVFAKDGWNQPAPWKCDTLNIAPGERWDVIIDCNNPGTWAFHCHILTHAESQHGMFGMVTALVVQE
jgi:FtsP/CotA-like multicopper oxidase with cupredoxin domain